MKVTHKQVEKLLHGEQAFTQLGFSMMITRMKANYAKNPSQSMLQTYVDEINAFLDKFKMIMDADYKIITKL